MTVNEMSYHCVLYFRQLKKNLTSCVTVLIFLIIILKFQQMVFHETQKQNSKLKGQN